MDGRFPKRELAVKGKVLKNLTMGSHQGDGEESRKRLGASVEDFGVVLATVAISMMVSGLAGLDLPPEVAVGIAIACRYWWVRLAG